jgi:hypothetical protein
VKKVKVKILDSVAGLADPQPTASLDAKYDMLRLQWRSRERPPSESSIEAMIGQYKQLDRYGQTPTGMKRDWSFRLGEIVLIPLDLAKKWEECGLCELVADVATAAA